jgi:hypothetical protein
VGGLLCRKCNTELACYDDSPALAEQYRCTYHVELRIGRFAFQLQTGNAQLLCQAVEHKSKPFLYLRQRKIGVAGVHCNAQIEDLVSSLLVICLLLECMLQLFGTPSLHEPECFKAHVTGPGIVLCNALPEFAPH